MRKKPLWNSVGLFVFIMQFALISCASAGRDGMFAHSFSFDTLKDSPDAEVLDYQYGSSRQFGTQAEKSRVAACQVFPAWGTYGAMPRGEFLYVKWRIKQTGEVHEDKVDLTTRLPADMTNYGIHFAIKGSQLYIYLTPPPGHWFVGILREPVSDKHAAYLKPLQIYPEQTK